MVAMCVDTASRAAAQHERGQQIVYAFSYFKEARVHAKDRILL